MRARAQSNVVGVVLLLAVSVVALGTLTAGVGTVVDDHAERAAAARTADALSEALRPARTTGRRVEVLRLHRGRLRTVDRDLRVLNDSGVVAHVPVDALAFETGARGTTVLGGAVVRHGEGWARFAREPSVSVAHAGDGDDPVLVVGAARLVGSIDYAAGGGATTRLAVRVTHRRRSLGGDRYRVAVETARPDPWREFFAARNATVSRRDVDGDGLASVVARFPHASAAHLVVHRTEVELRE